MKKKIIKYHFEIVLAVLFITLAVLCNYFDPFVNDLYSLQANSILAGRLELLKSSSDLLIFDSTIYKDSVFMSWGVWPALEYIAWSKLTFGLLSHSIIFYIHLASIPLLLRYISENTGVGYISLASPFFLYFLKEDVGAVDVSFVFGLSYFLLAVYSSKKSKVFMSSLFIVISALCRFGFLPILVLFTIVDSIRTRKYFLNLLTVIVTVASTLFVNYLKFNDFLFWGERFNKFQGEWITILKTLQVDSFSLFRITNAFIDFFRALFLNFKGEVIYGNSLTISQVNSVSLYIFLGAVVYLLLSKIMTIRAVNKSMLILLTADILFQILFVRFYSYRLLFTSFVLLMLSFDVRLKIDKLSLFVLLCCFVPILLLNNEVELRQNNVSSLQVRNEVYSYDYADKTEYLCNDVQESMKVKGQVFDSLFAGFVVDDNRCFVRNPFSALVHKEKKRCRLEVKLFGVDCNKLWLKSVIGDNIFNEENGMCSTILDNKYKGELILYFIYDFDNLIKGKNIYKNKSMNEFIRINLDCVNEY